MQNKITNLLHNMNNLLSEILRYPDFLSNVQFDHSANENQLSRSYMLHYLNQFKELNSINQPINVQLVFHVDLFYNILNSIKSIFFNHNYYERMCIV